MGLDNYPDWVCVACGNVREVCSAMGMWPLAPAGWISLKYLHHMSNPMAAALLADRDTLVCNKCAPTMCEWWKDIGPVADILEKRFGEDKRFERIRIAIGLFNNLGTVTFMVRIVSIGGIYGLTWGMILKDDTIRLESPALGEEFPLFKISDPKFDEEIIKTIREHSESKSHASE